MRDRHCAGGGQPNFRNPASALVHIRQSAAQQTAGSLHSTWAAEGRYEVEAVLLSAQHRETGASRVQGVLALRLGDE